jgi:hypothetical protein
METYQNCFIACDEYKIRNGLCTCLVNLNLHDKPEVFINVVCDLSTCELDDCKCKKRIEEFNSHAKKVFEEEVKPQIEVWKLKTGKKETTALENTSE